MRLTIYPLSKNKRYQGFTLLEGILSLVVLSVILASFTWLLQIEKELNKSQWRQLDTSLNWHLAMSNVENNSREWRFLRVSENKLYFNDRLDQEYSRIIVIEQNQQKIRKRIGRSTETILANVQKMTVVDGGSGIRMDVVFTDGSEYQGIFPHWR